MNLDEETIVRVLEENGHSVNDFISQPGLLELLTRLNGQPYDEDIFEQLWSQCKENSLGQVQLREFTDTILRAKKILVEQNNQAISQLARLDEQIRGLEKEHIATKDFRTRAQLERKIAQLEQLMAVEREKKADYNINLQIINKPFSIHRQRSARKATEAASPVKSVIQPPPSTEPTDEYNDLRCVLFTTLPLMITECLLMFQKTDFLNVPFIVTQLLFYCSVLLIFIIVNVDKTYIRVTLAILLMSVLTDILWMAMYAGKLWSPPQQSEYPHSTETFRRLCLFITLALIFGKLFIGVLLLKYRDLQRPIDVKLKLMGESAPATTLQNQPKNFLSSSLTDRNPQQQLF